MQRYLQAIPKDDIPEPKDYKTGGDVLGKLFDMGMPHSLLGVNAECDVLNSLSPYSSEFQNGVAKLLVVIRNSNICPVGGELPALDNCQATSTEDRRRLGTQQGKVDVA